MLHAIGDPDVELGPHAGWWAARMGEWARAADATIVISPFQQRESVRLLGLDPETVHWLPDGVDVESFSTRRASAERAAGALARVARARPAGLGRGERASGQHSLRTRRRCSTRSSTTRPVSRGPC